MERSAHAGARFRHRLRRVLPWAALGLAVVGAAGCRAPDDRVVVVPSPRPPTVTAGALLVATLAPQAASAPQTASAPTRVVSPTLLPSPTEVAVLAAPPTTPPSPPVTGAAPAPTSATRYTSAVVIYGGGDGLHLRAGPNAQKIATLLKGSVLSLRGVARDEGGFRWWPVKLAPGWLADGPRDRAQARWLAPLETERITPGQAARVVYPGGDGLNVRRAPGATSDKVATLLAGSTVRVVGEAQVVDGVTWWPIEVLPGWVAEGASNMAQPRWLQFQ